MPGSFLRRGFWDQFLLNFVAFGDPSGLSLRALGTPGDTQNGTDLNELEIVLTGVAKRVPWRLPGWILELLLDRFLT